MAHKNREARRLAHQQQQRLRTLAFGVIVVGVVGLAGWLLWSAFFRPGPPSGEGR